MSDVNRKDAVIAIAKILHEYDHPTYNTCTYCVFCIAHAEFTLDELPAGGAWSDASDD